MKIKKSVGTLAMLGVFFLALSTIPLKASAETIRLTFSTPVPQGSFIGKQHQWWADELKKRTDGRVNVRIYWMGSLVEWKDALHGVRTGMCDIATPCSTYNPSDFPLYMVLDMPYNGNDYWAAMLAGIETWENEPHLKAEIDAAGIKILGNWMSGFFNLGVAKPTNSIRDLKGKAFRSFGGARVKWMENMGINPIFMDYGAIYEAMDRGTIYGVEQVMILSDAFSHHEVVKDLFMTNAGFVLTCAPAMNLKKYESLPADIQKIMMQLRDDFAAHYAEELYKLEAGLYEKWEKEKGVNIKQLSAEDKKFSVDAALEAQEFFLNQQEAKGQPARKVWEYYNNSLKKYEKIRDTEGYPWAKK